MRVPGTTIGFEGGGIPMTVAVAGYTSDLVSANARSGTYAMRINHEAEGRYVQFPSNMTELYVRVGFRPSQVGAATFKNAIVTFRNSDGEPMLMLGYPSDTLTLTAYRNDGNYVALAVGADLSLNTWEVLEIHISLASADGIFQVKLNGALVIDFTGDTLGVESPASLRQLVLGCTSLAPPYVYAAQGLYDDVAVNDTTGDTNNTWVGRGGLWPVYVTGAGDLAQFTPSAGANWQCVDEVPANDDTDYVSSDTEGHQDSYEIDLPEVSGGVTVFTLWHRAKLAEAGAGNVTQQLRKSGVSYDGDLKGLDTTYRYVSHTWEVNPATGQPWTLEDLATFYVGQETS